MYFMQNSEKSFLKKLLFENFLGNFLWTISFQIIWARFSGNFFYHFFSMFIDISFDFFFENSSVNLAEISGTGRTRLSGVWHFLNRYLANGTYLKEAEILTDRFEKNVNISASLNILFRKYMFV